MKLVRVSVVLVTILLLTMLFNAKSQWDAQIEQHAERASILKKESGSGVAVAQAETERLEEPEIKKKAESTFYQLLTEKEVTSIKLIGDGITAGYGHPNYTSPDEGRIIFSGNGETFREAGLEFGSWANKLREYVSNPEFGAVDVINAGIRDKTADWALRNIDGLLQQDEEVLFVMIGTDDRIFSTLAQYEAVMRELLAIADERSDFLVVMSPPPSKQDLQPYNFSMEEIDTVLKEISGEKDYIFISQYDSVQQKLAKGVPYDALMQTEAANPVTGGYEVMWEELRRELDLK